MSIQASVGMDKTNSKPQCQDASWIYVGLGVSNIVAGFLVGVVYFSVRTFTSSMELTEVIPTYVNAIMAVCSGIIVLFVYKRKDKLLICSSIVLCLLTALVCAASAFLVGLEVIWTMCLYESCIYDEFTHKCSCFISNATFSPNIHNEREFVYDNARNCRVIEKSLWEFVCMADGLYVLLFVVNAISFVIASAECRKASLFSRSEQDNYICRTDDYASLPPMLGLHDLEALQMLDNWDVCPPELLHCDTQPVSGSALNRSASNASMAATPNPATPESDEHNDPRTPQPGQASGRSEEHSPRATTSVVSRQVALPGDSIPRLLGIRRLDGLPQGTLSISDLESQDVAHQETLPENNSGTQSNPSGSNQLEALQSSSSDHQQNERQNIDNIENELRLRQSDEYYSLNTSTPILDPVYSGHLRSLWNLQLLQLLRYRQSLFLNQHHNYTSLRNPSQVMQTRGNVNAERNIGQQHGLNRRQRFPLSRRHSDIITTRPSRPLNIDQRHAVNRTFSSSLRTDVLNHFAPLPEEPPPPYSVLPSWSNECEIDIETVNDSESLIQRHPRNVRPWVRRIFNNSSNHQSNQTRMQPSRPRRSRPPLAPISERRNNNQTHSSYVHSHPSRNRLDLNFPHRRPRPRVSHSYTASTAGSHRPHRGVEETGI